MSELVNQNDYGIFLDEILGLDQKIRHAAIFDGKYHAKFKDEVMGFVKKEEIKTSFSETKKQWENRKQMDFNFGDPRFTMAQFGKVNRITFPIGKEGVILVTTDLHIDVNKLVDKIIDIFNSFEYNLTGFFYR